MLVDIFTSKNGSPSWRYQDVRHGAHSQTKIPTLKLSHQPRALWFKNSISLWHTGQNT
jgi:hypothetical protein